MLFSRGAFLEGALLEGADLEGAQIKQNPFLTCSWRFLRSNISEQLEFKLEKIIGI